WSPSSRTKDAEARLSAGLCAVFSRRSLASGEVGRDDARAAVADERPEAVADPDPPEARPEQDGAVGRAHAPGVDHPGGGDVGGPSEVLAEDGTMCSTGKCPLRHGAVCEVLAAHHVRRMGARRPKKVDIYSERCEAVARPHGVHRLQERGLGAGQRAGLSGTCGPEQGETCQKCYENLRVNGHRGSLELP